jgi:Skp family chaperone for outer membrane proteins
MKKFIIAFVITILFSTNIYATETAYPKTVIGIINLNMIQRDAKVFNYINEQKKLYVEKYQKEITVKEAELKKENEKLVQQKNLLTPKAFEEKSKEFKTSLIKFQRKLQEKTAIVNRAHLEAIDNVQSGGLLDIIAKVSNKHKINMVVAASQAIFYKPEIDITKEVIAELDKKLIKVNFPNPESYLKKSKK